MKVGVRVIAIKKLAVTVISAAALGAASLPERAYASLIEEHVGQVSFETWARESLIPLSTFAPGHPWEDLHRLGETIGSATVVALGEGSHLGAEPLEFRNRLFEYLVQEKGFTAIAIESGIVESRAVHDYVRGGAGGLSAALTQGIGWTFDRFPQNRALVRWLREYNADPQNIRKVNFYGFDVPGSPGNLSANRGMDTALLAVLEYLSGVDSAAGVAFHTRFDPLLKSVRLDFSRPTNGPNYGRLAQGERDVLTAAIADLIALMDRREAVYTGLSNANDYAWAYRAAIGARQVDHWLRSYPIGWQPSANPLDSRSDESGSGKADQVRDRAQADNLGWIIGREGAQGKILLFAHNAHVSMTPIKLSLPPPSGALQRREVAWNGVMGTYLRRRLGDRLLTIGNMIGKGEIGCASLGYRLKLMQPLPGSLDGIASKVGVPLFLLDLRAAPVHVANWLDQVHILGPGQQMSAEYDVFYEYPVGKAFDVLFYVDAATPACKTTLNTH